MNEKLTKLVMLDGFAESERVMFKLIFSVSQRTKSRHIVYQLVDSDEREAVDLLVRNSQPPASEHISVHILNPAVATTPGIAPSEAMLTRPLIATRVLSTLDKLVNDHREIATATVEQSQPSAPSTDTTSEPQSATAIDEDIEFSISEEEASELALVDDESLGNPANMIEPTTLPTMLPTTLPTIDRSAREEQTTPSDQVQRLVLVSSSGKPQQDAAQDQAVQLQQSCPSLKALVVDDSASVRKQLEIELDLFAVTADYAENAQQAYELLQANHYDVAFLDVVLPDKDGFSICKSIKTDASVSDTNVIMLTGKATPADKVKGSLAGCDAYLVKPVGRMTFQNTVKKYIPLLDSPQAMGA